MLGDPGSANYLSSLLRSGLWVHRLHSASFSPLSPPPTFSLLRGHGSSSSAQHPVPSAHLPPGLLAALGVVCRHVELWAEGERQRLQREGESHGTMPATVPKVLGSFPTTTTPVIDAQHTAWDPALGDGLQCCPRSAEGHGSGTSGVQRKGSCLCLAQRPFLIPSSLPLFLVTLPAKSEILAGEGKTEPNPSKFISQNWKDLVDNHACGWGAMYWPLLMFP